MPFIVQNWQQLFLLEYIIFYNIIILVINIYFTILEILPRAEKPDVRKNTQI